MSALDVAARSMFAVGDVRSAATTQIHAYQRELAEASAYDDLM
ncbi:hypothetical protein ABH945_006967 [Paraburkholderia sp. GAS333]